MAFSTTNPNHGDIREGWSQQESASPHSVGNTTGSTRQTSFSADAVATSDLLLGSSIAADGPFASLGTSLDVTLNGDTVSASSYDVDSMLLPQRTFPPVAAGWEESALDLLNRMYGSGGVTLPWPTRGSVHAYYPLRGHDQGFTVDGTNRPYTLDDWGKSFNRSSSSIGSFYRGEAACLVNYWERQPSGVVALRATPMFAPIITGTGVNYLATRLVMTSSGAVRVRVNLAWSTVDPSTNIDIKVNRTTGTAGLLAIGGSYRKHNASTATTITETSIGTGSVDMSKPVQLVLQWGWTTTAVDGTLRVKAYVYDPDAPPTGAPPIVVQVDLVNAMRSELVSNSSEIVRTAGGGGFRDVILSQMPAGIAYHYPQIVEPTLVTHDFVKTQIGVYPPEGQLAARPPIHGWTGSGFEYLKMLCSARAKTFRVVDGRVHVTDLPLPTAFGDAPGLIRRLAKSDTLTAPTLRQQGSGRARSVDVLAYKSVVTRSFTPKPTARLDVGITVRVKEKDVAKAIALAPGAYQSGRVEFFIRDANDSPLAFSDFFDRGGRIEVAVIDNTLHLLAQGPGTDQNIGEAPWTITSARLFNVGYVDDIEPITLYTSAPEAMITREQAGTVGNPFLSSQGEVYERGMWAAAEMGEPQQTLSFSVPAHRRALFPAGQLVAYGFAVYRVMTVTHSKASTSVTCSLFTTSAMVDAAWPASTRTLAEYDAHMNGAPLLYQTLRPMSLPADTAGIEPRPFLRPYPSESKWSD